MTQIGTAFVKVVVDTANVQRDLDKTKGSILGWGKSLAKAGGALAAVGIAGDFLVDSVKAAQEAQRVQEQLERQVNSTAGSYEQYQDVIESTIASTSNLAAVDDEDLAESFTKLVGSTGDVEDALTGMQSAADLSAARGISLEAATKAVEKAMNGGVAGLKKFGIQLDKNADRQEVVAALQKKFGGAAEAYGKTAAGAQERFGIAMEGVKEQLGTALLPLITKFFNAVSDGLVWWQANWPKISAAIADGYRIAKPILDLLVAQIKMIATIVADVARLVAAIVHGDWDKAWKELKQLAVDYINGLVTVVKNLPIFKAVRFLIDEMLRAMREAVDEVKRAAGKVGDAIVDGIKAYLNFYATIGRVIVEQIGKAATWVVTNFGTPFAKVASLIADKVSAVLDFSVSLGTKLLNGVKAAASWLISKIGPDTFKGLAQAIKDAVTGALAGIGDWIQRQLEKIPGYGTFKKLGGLAGAITSIPGVPGGRSAPAAAAGSGGGASAGVRATSGGGMLGSSSGVGALGLSGLGVRQLSLSQPVIAVSVYIGDEELTSMIRTEIVSSNTRVARTLLAGAR